VTASPDKADPKFVPPASSKPAISPYNSILVSAQNAFNRTKVTFFQRDSASIPKKNFYYL